MRIDHVTAVVQDVESATGVLERLFDRAPSAVLDVPGMAIRSFAVGDAELHLTAPTGAGPAAAFLAEHGPGLHHLALRLPDLDTALLELTAKGFSTVGQPIETAPGLREVFLDPRGTGGLLIQLVERRVAREPELDSSAVAKLVESTPR